jgi:hypothetical protein
VSIAFSSVAACAAAVAGARRVDLAAYTLRAGAIRDALLAAAHAGASVRVRLERDPLDDAAGTLHAANAQTVAVLAAAGADAALTAPGTPVLHLKAALADGVAWLDDRNWAGAGDEIVLRDSDPDDVAAVGAALDGGRGADGHLRTTKAGAQALELDVIRSAGAAPLVVESESFGSGAVYNALLARARTGAPTRLLVAEREAAEAGPRGATEVRRLERLAALGVEVRTGVAGGLDFDEKLAATPAAAWVGSANATYARGAAGEQRDWGLLTREAPLVDGVRIAFERNWSRARPFDAGTSADTHM